MVRAGISSATPVAKAAADAACPEGKDVVRAACSRRAGGTSVAGRTRWVSRLPTTLLAVLAMAMLAIPRSAARRAHLLLVAASPAATPIHRTLWLAARLSA